MCTHRFPWKVSCQYKQPVREWMYSCNKMICLVSPEKPQIIYHPVESVFAVIKSTTSPVQQCGKTSACNYCNSESQGDTPCKLTPENPDDHTETSLPRLFPRLHSKAWVKLQEKAPPLQTHISTPARPLSSLPTLLSTSCHLFSMSL